jgi:phosphoglycerol transferase MdoB-like AlkP superfamily enzyme
LIEYSKITTKNKRDMEDKATPIESLFERAEAYGKTSLKLLKLKAIDKSSELISTIMSWLIVIIVAALFFIILNIGIALWLGEILGKTYYGFFIVAGIYAVLGVIFILWAKKYINNSIISKMLK